MGKVLTIDFGDDFLGKLAEGLLAGDARLGTATAAAGAGATATQPYETIIALPTRRACLYFTELLLQKRDCLLLPKIIPLGELEEALDELEGGLETALDAPLPTIHPIERHLTLSALIRESGFAGDSFPSRYLGLGMALGQFIDLTDRFEVDRHALKTLAPDTFAEHWQKILNYLDLLVDAWPDYLTRRGKIDLVAARALSLRSFAANVAQLDAPLIVAGSTGSQPATAALLKATAAYKKGVVILPSLDLGISDDMWETLPPTHPQFGLKNLLEKIEIPRSAVEAWGTPPNPARTTFIRALFGKADPAAAAAAAIEDGIKNITLIEANNSREEASFIAFALLEQLEKHKGADAAPTLALVTPDRTLAQRVRLVLQRFGVEIDDEAGVPLTTTPTFIFLKLIAEVFVARFEPLALLSCLKHPLALGGQTSGSLREEIRALEFELRNHTGQLKTNKTGLDFYKNNVGESFAPLLERLQNMFAPLLAAAERKDCTLSELLTAHIESAERLAASNEEAGAVLLWGHNEITKSLAQHLHDLLQHKALLDSLGRVPLDDYPSLFESLFATAPAARYFRVIGSPLHIWQPPEARLQKADLMILGGLNEGAWPAHLAPDPWLSRAMRKKLGLESEEMQIGLSAHDFAEGLAHDKVILTRAKKDADGNPLKPSPWLLRLSNLLESNKITLTQKENYPEIIKNFYHKELVVPEKKLPQPPLEAKPKKISASAFTELLNDPYAFYAKRILRLKELNDLSSKPQAAERGSLIHNILEDFVKTNPNALPDDAEEKLLAHGKHYFENNQHPAVRLFWWSQFETMAKAFIQLEKTQLRSTPVKIATEIEGRWETKINDTPMTLTARADRIDMSGNHAAIYDYKTGSVPAKNHVPHKAPQLPFEALILSHGGFEGLAATDFTLAYIALKKKNAHEMYQPRDFSLHDVAHLVRSALALYLSDNMAWKAEENSVYKTYHHLARIDKED